MQHGCAHRVTGHGTHASIACRQCLYGILASRNSFPQSDLQLKYWFVQVNREVLLFAVAALKLCGQLHSMLQCYILTLCVIKQAGTRRTWLLSTLRMLKQWRRAGNNTSASRYALEGS